MKKKKVKKKEIKKEEKLKLTARKKLMVQL